MSSSRVTGLIRYALFILGKRSYSTADIKRKLQNRWKLVERHQTRMSQKDETTSPRPSPSEGEGGSMEKDVQEVMEYLEKHRLLDDAGYAALLTRNLEGRHKSQTYIRQKLKMKGLTPPPQSESFPIFHTQPEADAVTSFLPEERESFRDSYVLLENDANDTSEGGMSSDQQSLLYLIRRKLDKDPDLFSDPKKKLKLKRWLFARGFRYDDIDEAIKKYANS